MAGSLPAVAAGLRPLLARRRGVASD